VWVVEEKKDVGPPEFAVNAGLVDAQKILADLCTLVRLCNTWNHTKHNLMEHQGLGHVTPVLGGSHNHEVDIQER
jgi:hypothetical protein